MTATLDRTETYAAFQSVVNMTADEIESWLETEESRAVGWKGKDGDRPESIRTRSVPEADPLQ